LTPAPPILLVRRQQSRAWTPGRLCSAVCLLTSVRDGPNRILLASSSAASCFMTPAFRPTAGSLARAVTARSTVGPTAGTTRSGSQVDPPPSTRRPSSMRHSTPGRYLVTGEAGDQHVFKVPSLRNVALTAPYFQDGTAKTLDAAVDVMFRYQLGRTASSPGRAANECELAGAP
jgi:hypothetical protein